MNCLPMHVVYAFFSENAYVPNMSCGNCVTSFEIQLGRPHLVL